jgi:hypothetical protein
MAGEMEERPRAPVYVGGRTGPNNPQSLADVLERVLDKGIVIVGDIQVRLLDIELLTIKIRLMVASVDRAKEMGINWWEGDAFVTNLEEQTGVDGGGERTAQLEQRIDDLEKKILGALEANRSPAPAKGDT